MTEQPGEHHEPEPIEDPWDSINRLLDQYAEVLQPGLGADDPELEAQKDSLKEQLDEYVLSDENRGNKLAAMVEEAANAYHQASTSRQEQPENPVVSEQYQVAAEALSKAVFINEVDRLLLEAQRQGDQHADQSEADSKVLAAASEKVEDIQQYRQMQEAGVNPEALRDKLAYDLNSCITTIMHLKKIVDADISEVQQPQHQKAWARIQQEVFDDRQSFKLRMAELVMDLNIPAVLKAEHPKDFTDKLQKKSVAELSHALHETDVIIRHLIEISKHLAEALKRKTE